jgi:hypothetical protein
VSIAATISAAIARELRGVLSIEGPRVDPGVPARRLFSQQQAVAMLRVEMTHEVFELLCAPYDLTCRPTQFQGVAVYRCGPEYDLPGCGWRIVNPMVRA